MSEDRPERKRQSDQRKQEVRVVKQVEGHQQREANHKGSQEKEEELLQCADLSLYLGVWLLYFAIILYFCFADRSSKNTLNFFLFTSYLDFGCYIQTG